MNIHNGKTQQRIEKTQPAATHSNAPRSTAQRMCERALRNVNVAIHSEPEKNVAVYFEYNCG